MGALREESSEECGPTPWASRFKVSVQGRGVAKPGGKVGLQLLITVSANHAAVRSLRLLLASCPRASCRSKGFCPGSHWLRKVCSCLWPGTQPSKLPLQVE